jgi:hypothetical protein
MAGLQWANEPILRYATIECVPIERAARAATSL